LAVDLGLVNWIFLIIRVCVREGPLGDNVFGYIHPCDVEG